MMYCTPTCVKSACMEYGLPDNDCCATLSDAGCASGHEYSKSLAGCGRGLTAGQYSTCCTPRTDATDTTTITTTEPPQLWRTDGRCGSKHPLPSGNPAQCNPNHPKGHTCCSPRSWCGNTDHHCKCASCLEYTSWTQAVLLNNNAREVA